MKKGRYTGKHMVHTYKYRIIKGEHSGVSYINTRTVSIKGKPSGKNIVLPKKRLSNQETTVVIIKVPTKSKTITIAWVLIAPSVFSHHFIKLLLNLNDKNR